MYVAYVGPSVSPYIFVIISHSLGPKGKQLPWLPTSLLVAVFTDLSLAGVVDFCSYH